MKKHLFIALALCLGAEMAKAQAPEGFNYQAVVRDISHNPLSNQPVGMRMAILQGSINGTVVYSETFSPTTNDYGLVNLEVGAGSTTDDLALIDWSAGPYFIETAIDISGGNAYQVMGTSQLLSVPFAMHAKSADHVLNDQVDDADADPNNEIQDLSLTGTDLSISNGSTISLAAIDTDTQLDEAAVDAYVSNNGYINSEVDGSVTNEIQDISLNGTNLSISSGSTVDLSNIGGAIDEATVDAYVANNGYITNEIDGSVTNEIQDISLNGTNLSISNGSTVDLAAGCGLEIGDIYAGGYVIYVDGSGCHGLVADMLDLGSMGWDIGGAANHIKTSTRADWLYAGLFNTERILQVYNAPDAIAANACVNSTSGGYDDWYLPSAQELEMMYAYLHLRGIGNFFGTGLYWSSTELNINEAKTKDFGTAVLGSRYKGTIAQVRAVRKF